MICAVNVYIDSATDIDINLFRIYQAVEYVDYKKTSENASKRNKKNELI